MDECFCLQCLDETQAVKFKQNFQERLQTHPTWPVPEEIFDEKTSAEADSRTDQEAQENGQ